MQFAKISEMLTNGERGVLVTVLQSTPLFQPLQGTHWLWQDGRIELLDVGRERIKQIMDKFEGEVGQIGEKDVKCVLAEIPDGKVELSPGSETADLETNSKGQFWQQELTQVCQQVLVDRQFCRERVELTDQWLDLMLEPILPKSRLVILGAGHVGQSLAKMAHLVQLPVILIDDRPDFANPHLFSEEIQVICDDFLQAIDQLQLTEHDYLVIVTRGHQYDRNCLEKVAGMELAYVGMIGSRRRIRGLFAELEKAGVDPEWLEGVHSPIGLEIGAETPQEIGVSILAELIQVRRKGAQR